MAGTCSPACFPTAPILLIAFLRQCGFVVLYALMLTGMLNAIIEPPTAFFQRILVP